MDAPATYDIKEGDRLKWRFPGSGIPDECTVQSVISRTDDGVSVYTDHVRYTDGRVRGAYTRHVLVDWLTHYNGRRLDQARISRHEEEKSVDFNQEAEVEQIHFTGKEPAMATKAKATKAKKPAGEEMLTSHRKSLDDMSEAHRAHIEKWEPHLIPLGGEGVWGFASLVPGRGATGPCYIALKRGPKDYAIISYDTEKMVKVTKRHVEEDGIESSTALLEAFKPYRIKAKEERNAAKSSKAAKPKPKARPARKAAPKKTAAKKPAAKKTAAKKRTRKTAAKK